ncbi:unnamed protein product [Pipistrellus nathusii]|uniref:Uncharacterized protein n=1 Tax=Pipistrellus nathusii TaxID=59473 RepID=A0ABP0A7D8_PIPNA
MATWGLLGGLPKRADFGMAHWSPAGQGPHPCQAGPGPALYIHWFLIFFFCLFFLFFFSFNLKRQGRGQGGGLGREQQQEHLSLSPSLAGWRLIQVGAQGPPSCQAHHSCPRAPRNSLHHKSPA